MKVKLVILLCSILFCLFGCSKDISSQDSMSEQQSTTEQETIEEETTEEETTEPITESATSEDSAFKPITKYIIEDTDIKAEEDMDSEIVCSLKVNTEVEVIDMSDDEEWSEIVCLDGVEGFVLTEFLGDEMVAISPTDEASANNGNPAPSNSNNKEQTVSATSQQEESQASAPQKQASPTNPPSSNASVEEQRAWLNSIAEMDGGYVDNTSNHELGGLGHDISEYFNSVE